MNIDPPLMMFNERLIVHVMEGWSYIDDHIGLLFECKLPSFFVVTVLSRFPLTFFTHWMTDSLCWIGDWTCYPRLSLVKRNLDRSIHPSALLFLVYDRWTSSCFSSNHFRRLTDKCFSWLEGIFCSRWQSLSLAFERTSRQTNGNSLDKDDVNISLQSREKSLEGEERLMFLLFLSIPFSCQVWGEQMSPRIDRENGCHSYTWRSREQNDLARRFRPKLCLFFFFSVKAGEMIGEEILSSRRDHR